jgi:hypothetical protein
MQSTILPTILSCASVFAGAAAVLPAQQTILFSVDTDSTTRANGSGLFEAGAIHPDEIAQVTPLAGQEYSASCFLSVSAQWAYVGDEDMDGRLLDSSTESPQGDTDAVFVKHLGGTPVGAPNTRQVYLSKEGSTTNSSALFADGDVFRFVAQGVVEKFLTEAQLLTALGQASGDLDLNAICQTTAGDLFVSFEAAELVNGVSLEDGGFAMIPAAAITYDGNGNVSAVTNASAVIVATEADVNAMIAQSGVRTSVGGAPSTSIDLSGLELDPNGGTWTTPQGSLVVPNVLFTWDGFSNDGAILSTAGGGSIAVINGVPMGSPVATTGLQVGLLPESTGIFGINGLAIADSQPNVVTVENYPTNLITTSTILWTRHEVSNATPGGTVFFFVDFGPIATGSVLPAFAIPGVGGQFFGTLGLFSLGSAVADPRGYASRSIQLPPAASGSGVNVAWQVFDLGRFTFGTPAAMQFL